MALTASDLQTKRDLLMGAISSGVRRITFQDRLIEYQSTDAMLMALAYLDDELKGLSGSSRKRSSVAQFIS